MREIISYTLLIALAEKFIFCTIILMILLSLANTTAYGTPINHWENSAKSTLHTLAGDDLKSYFGFIPNLKIIHNALPKASISSCQSISISTGLLELIDAPTQLAFLLAHEAAHHMLGHLHTINDHDSPENRWSIDQEVAADRLALKLMHNKGYSTNNIPELLKRIEDFSGGYKNSITLGNLYPSIKTRRINLENDLLTHKN
jgi:Zn-dependent protease with chaperone function